MSNNNKNILYCSFCGKSQHEVRKLIAGPTVFICDECVELCMDIIKEEIKTSNKSDKKNKDAFISTGLWGLSRHPNYFGEILLWIGMAVIALPTLVGWQYVTLISPIFIYFLLTRVSGVNLLEDRANQKWGGTEEYASYVKKTSVHIPFTK